VTTSVQPVAPAPASSRIPSLDGLRGIAILMVLIGHSAYSLPAGIVPLVTFLGNGLLGVSIFFVLSGFLIHQLSVREVQTTGRFDWKQFYIRRALRIFPCFYLFLIVICLLVNLGMLRLTGPMLFSAATFSLNYRHLWDHGSTPSDYIVIGHYWTLALEEQFYLTWPLLMFLFLRRKLLKILVLIILLAPVIRVLSYFAALGSRAQIGMMFHTAFDSIAFGVLLGELFQNPQAKAWLQNLASNNWILGSTTLFAFVISPLFADQFGARYILTIGRTLDLASICLLVTAAISFPGTRLFRLLNWPPLAYLGVLSYSIYVWNNLFLNSEKHWLVNSFPLNFLCVFGMALLSHYLVEKPFLKLKNRFHKTAAA